jgi:hypothetical protein
MLISPGEKSQDAGTRRANFKVHKVEFLSFFLGGTGFELKTLHLQSRFPNCLSHTSNPFSTTISGFCLEIESQELFAQGGLEPPSSQSQPPK